MSGSELRTTSSRRCVIGLTKELLTSAQILLHRPDRPEDPKAPASRSEAGTTMILVAGLLCVLLAFTGLATDAGSLFLTRRQLQAATDAAALAAALDLSQVSYAAGASLTSNGYSTATMVAVTPGQYQEDPTIPPAQRFTATQNSPNAVQVQTEVQSPLYLMRVLMPQSSMAVGATATAVRNDLAAFTAGTGLVDFNGGVANAILGSMLGSSVSLDAVSYNGLLNTNINVADFMNALATQANLTAGTYSNLLSSEVTVGSILQAAVTAATSEGLSASAPETVAGLQSLLSAAQNTQGFPLSSLLNLDFAQGLQIGTISATIPGMASVNLYQLVSAAAILANGSNAVAATSIVNIPGIATADLYMTAIEPAQPPAPVIEYGPVGTSVHTAQVRLLLTINLLNPVSASGTTGAVSLPVYIELASGNASLTGISCSTQPATDATVTIAAQPSLASVYIAQVNKSLMTNFTQPVSTNTPATIVSLGGLASVTAAATLSLGSPNPTDLTFTQTEMEAQPPQSQTVSSTGMLANAIDTLANSTQYQVVALGLPVLPAVAQTVTTAVTSSLVPVLTSLDQLVDPILATLGVQLGYINVSADGVRCGVSSLAS
jgi:uncharacterized membrane protein